MRRITDWFNRPFWDGSRMRRRHPGERRGYNPVLLATELVGSVIILGASVAVLALPIKATEFFRARAQRT